jgi:hypothetical protein
MEEDNVARFRREWAEFLNEIRVALPGVQFLFGFLVTLPFTNRFAQMSSRERMIYFVSFICTTAASVLLMTPPLYHRLHWRRDVLDKEEMIRTCNRLAIAGISLLAVAMVSSVLLLATVLTSSVNATIVAAAIGGLIAWLWFALPIRRRIRDERRLRKKRETTPTS